MSYRVQCFDSYDGLPESYTELLSSSEDGGFFYQREWFDHLMKHVHMGNQHMRLFAVEDSATGMPLLLTPLRYTEEDSAVFRARTIAAIGHMENYAPACFLISASNVDKRRELMTVLFRWFKEKKHSETPECIDVVRLWPFAVPSSLGDDVLRAVTDAGFSTQIYANSFNQYEECAGLDYLSYFEKRSSNQRYNIRRRRRNLEKEGDLEFVMVADDKNQQELQAAIDDYILVSVRSWKELDSTVSPATMSLLDLAASKGCLRLGILRLNGIAIAAQFWIFSAGIASMIRPNYHEQYKKFAPGVVLTNFVVEYLLDTDKAHALDLGYGTDEYKGKWVDTSRGYSGIMAFNPSTPRGAYFGFKHIFGQQLKQMVKRVKSLLGAGGGT